MYKIFNFETFNEEAYDNSNGARFWGDAGAGIFIICKDTGRALVAYRSKHVNEPHTWSLWGGKIDGEESPENAAKRELEEETGYNKKYEIIPAYVFKNKDFSYYNYIAIVEKEFRPKLNWESEKFAWLNKKELNKLEPKHFGFELLLKNSADLISKYLK